MSDFEKNQQENQNPNSENEQPVMADEAQATRTVPSVEDAAPAGQPAPLPRRRRSDIHRAAEGSTPDATQLPRRVVENTVQKAPSGDTQVNAAPLVSRRRVDAPTQSVPRSEAIRREAVQQPDAGNRREATRLRPAAQAPGYAQSRPQSEQQLQRAKRTAEPTKQRMDVPAEPQETGHKPHWGLVAVVIAVLLVASLLLGMLLIPDNTAGVLGTVKSAVVGVLGGSKSNPQPVYTEAPEVMDFSAAPTRVMVGQTITFTLTTSKNVKNVRLVNDEETPLTVQNKMWDNADGIIWSMSLTMNEPYDGGVRLQIENNDEWIATDKTMGIQVLASAAVQETLEAVPETPAAEETIVPEEEAAASETEAPVTDAPATQVPVTEAPVEEQTEETPVVTDAPTQAATPTMVISPTPTIPVDAVVTQAPVMIGQTPAPAVSEEAPAEIPDVLDFNTIHTTVTVGETMSFNMTTTADAADVRLVNAEGEPFEVETSNVAVDNQLVWFVNLTVDAPYVGKICVQVSDGESWYDIDRSLDVSILDVPADDVTGEVLPDDGVVFDDDPVIEEVVTAQNDPDAASDAAPLEDQETGSGTFRAAAADSADPALIADRVVYDGNSKINSYVRELDSAIDMPAGDGYTPRPYGVLTFRGDNFRRNAAFDTIGDGEPTALTVAWKTPAGSAKGSGSTYYGIGWTGQPAIIKWAKEVRSATNIAEEKKDISGLREVIIAGEDGRIYFLDLVDGQETRKTVNVGYPLRGTPSIHPYGFPLMAVGQYARKMASGTGDIGMRLYNLLDQKQLFMIDGLDKNYNRPYYTVGAFDTSSLYDAEADTLISVGTNGMLYLTKLNTKFSYDAQGKSELTVGSPEKKENPLSIVMKSRVKGEANKSTAVESSAAMYGSYVYYADMDGILRCVDTNTLEIVWAVDTGDAVEATIALDQDEDGNVWLYTANTVQNRKKGDCDIRRYNAATGEEDWTLAVNVTKQKKTIAGAMASPVIGQNGLSDYAYFTVSFVSKNGAAAVGLSTKKDVSALLCVEKATGKVVWSYQLSSYSYSSPVAVYNNAGEGWIAQAANDGTLVLINGLTGEVVNSVKLNGSINASPAVYKNTLVIGTQGSKKGASAIYAITIE